MPATPAGIAFQRRSPSQLPREHPATAQHNLSMVYPPPFYFCGHGAAPLRATCNKNASSLSFKKYKHYSLSQHIHIGKLVATHGLQGEVVMKHSLGKKTQFKKGDVVFVEIRKAELLPYFTESCTAKNDSESIILFEGVATKEAAAKLLQKKTWLTKTDFDARVSKSAPVNLIDFLVVNEGEQLGAVEAVIEQPQQVLLQLTVQGKEVLVPINESTLKKIDRKKKEVHVTLPHGLLDVYLA